MRDGKMGRLLIAVCLMVSVLAGSAPAQDKKSADKWLDRSSLDELIYENLRETINHGANLYNQGDWNGCYRLWEGALMTLKPMLEHRPKLQEAIDSGVAEARQDPALWHRAWVLRPVLNKIRADIKADHPTSKKQEADGKPAEKQPVEKKPAEKKEEKSPEEKKQETTANITGKLTYKGLSLTTGAINFLGNDNCVLGTIDEDGTYKLSEVRPGIYKVTIATPSPPGKFVPGAKPPDGLQNERVLVKIPPKYARVKTSGLTVRVKEGKQTQDFNLHD